MDESTGMGLLAGGSVAADTREQILQAALAVLVEAGQAGFTTRRVAERAGIAVGNLTYHYPSKQSLIQAMIGSLLAHYQRRFGDMLATRHVQDGLHALIDWLLNDALDETTVRIFRELWALAMHDDEIARAVDDFYAQTMQQTSDLLMQHYPQAEPQAVNELVMLLALAAEGCIVLYGTRPGPQVAHARVVSLVQQLAARLMQEASGPQQAGARDGALPT